MDLNPSRRAFLTAGMAVVAGCRRQRDSGFDGYAFVANEEGHAIAAVDLSAFAVARHIRLNAAPTQVIAHEKKPFVYALTPQTGVIHEIDTRKLAVTRTLHIGAHAPQMRLDSDQVLWALASEGRKLVRVNLDDFKPEGQISLPSPANDLDLASYFDRAIAVHGPEGAISWIDLAKLKVAGHQRLATQLGQVRFLGDGKSVIAANLSDRLITAIRAEDRRIIAHLPLAIRPDNLCFNHDGGQLFITGDGRDAVVVVFPYYTPQIAETVLAGHAPGAMAATDRFLFVANPQAGDVSILNITRRRVVAVAAVGSEPAHIALTPKGTYALVLNRRSGDMAVIRTSAIVPDRRKSAALFTMIPVGSKPVSAAVKAVG